MSEWKAQPPGDHSKMCARSIKRGSPPKGMLSYQGTTSYSSTRGFFIRSSHSRPTNQKTTPILKAPTEQQVATKKTPQTFSQWEKGGGLCYCGCHLSNHGMMIPLQIPTNNGSPRFQGGAIAFRPSAAPRNGSPSPSPSPPQQ